MHGKCVGRTLTFAEWRLSLLSASPFRGAASRRLTLCAMLWTTAFSSPRAWTSVAGIVSNAVDYAFSLLMARTIRPSAITLLLQEMIDEADRDGDGEVNEEEFLRIMKKTNLF
jgi:hypothetical protein